MRFREHIALGLYIGIINLLMPVGILLGLPFLLMKDKRRKTLFRRLGFQHFPNARANNRPVWVHALSLGETLSCVTLVEQLRSELGDRPLYFSVSTLAAMQIASERIRPHADGIFYFPLDLSWPVRRSLRQIAPALMVFIETDIWPGFQHHLRRTRTPAVLVNARLSPRTYRMCDRFRSLYAPALNTFHTIFPQSDTEARRYLDVGASASRLGGAGNLKFDVANCPMDAVRLRSVFERLSLGSTDIVMLAGSTHPGEEQAVLEAYGAVAAEFRSAKLVIVPRHPARAGEVMVLASRNGRRARLYTSVTKRESWDVLVVDVMGVLSMLYTVATVSFIGGSLVSKGGQNPLEPAAAGSPVMFGSDMSDFPDIARGLLDAGGACEVSGASDLADKWLHVLRHEDERERMCAACRRVVEAHSGSTARITRAIVALLEAG